METRIVRRLRRLTGRLLAQRFGEFVRAPHQMRRQHERKDVHRPARTRDAIGPLVIQMREPVRVVRIRLQSEDRVQERHPVRIAGVRLEIHEIARRQVHRQLSIELRAKLLAFRLQRDARELASRSQEIEILPPGQEALGRSARRRRLPRPFRHGCRRQQCRSAACQRGTEQLPAPHAPAGSRSLRSPRARRTPAPVITRHWKVSTNMPSVAAPITLRASR